MRLTGKTILLTGASTGIGKALAFELAKEKCNLILVARRIELLEEIQKELHQINGNVTIAKCDVGVKAEVESAYQLIKTTYNKIDIAILNAGMSKRVTVKTYDSRIAEQTFATNVLGIIYWVEQLLPEFINRKEGWIVGVSSLADNRGYSGSSFYCASKAAVTNYLEGLRIECKQYNIKITTVKPGFVTTPMTDGNKHPMPFIMPPGKAARIIVSGLKRNKRMIQFPRRLVLITKIIGIIPGRIFDFLAVKFLGD